MAKTHSPKIDALLWSWLTIARRFRKTIIFLWATFAIIGLWLSVSLLGVNTDTSDMIDESVPYRVAQAEFEKAFPDLNDQILIIIRANRSDELDIYSSDFAQALRDSDKVRGVSHAASDPFFAKNGLLYLETEALEDQLTQLTEAAPLIERLTLSPKIETLFDTLAQIETRQDKGADSNTDALFNGVTKTLEANLSGGAHPFSWRDAFSGEAAELNQTIILVEPVLDYSRVRPAAPVQELIENLTREISDKSSINAQVYVTGNPVLRSDELKSVSQGIGLAFLISFIVVGIILFFALRTPSLVIFILLSLIISILITSGLAALIFGELNLVSVAFTVLMVGLGVDFAIHLLMHLQHERHMGLSIPANFYRTSRKIGTALVLTAPSTALAFLAFVPTNFVGISQLGVIAAIGVIIAFLVATSLLPAIFSYLPTISTPAQKQLGSLRTFSLKPESRSHWAVLVMALGLGALALIPQARFDADPMALRDQKAPSVTAFNLLFSEPETVPYRLSVLTNGPEEALAITDKLKTAETVGSTRSINNFIPKDQYDKLDLIDYAAIGLEFALSGDGTPPTPNPNSVGNLLESLKENKTEAARNFAKALRAWQTAIKTDPDIKAQSERDIFLYWPREVERLNAQIFPSEVSLETLPDSLSSRFQAETGQTRVEILPANDVRNIQNRRDFVTEVTEILPQATGSARSVQEAGDIIQASVLQALGVALLTVSILLFLVVRNIRLVIIMLIPLLLAGILTTATGVLINLPYNFANVIVLPLLIGIGVDSSLHLALQNKDGTVNIKPKKRSLSENVTPRAVIFSAITTIASFGSLSFSAHRGTASMGLLLMIAIGWVLICTLLVTPTLLNWSTRKREQM